MFHSTLLIAALACPQDASAGTTPAPDLESTFELPEGLEVTLWAESPSLFNPTAIDVDARGRVWVCEAVNYRQWNGRNPGKHFDEGDRIVILEDTDGDGVCDASKVFVQDADLTAPLGIALVGNRVYVSCSPNLYVYIDDDGDDRADRRETVLTGFGGHDHDHGLHSVVPHADGKLYVAIGNAGPHIVTGPDGWTLRSGSYYNGGGQKSADNKPGLVSDDGKAWTGGLILRMDHDGSNMEVLAHNFRNIYEVAVDAYGDMYTADNDDDGNRSCRTTWVMPGGNYGFFDAGGTRSWQADRRPGLTTQEAHWHQQDPGVVPAGTINGGGGPTGVCVYEGELMAGWISGAVLNCDAGARVVYAHRPRSVGAGIVLDPGFLIRPERDASGESGTWFRPSDVAVGPGGDVYVADWYDPGVGGHAARDREAYGRILRIAPKGAKVVVPALDLESSKGLLAALDSPAVAVREIARTELLRPRPADERPWSLAALHEAYAHERSDTRLRARIGYVLAALPQEVPASDYLSPAVSPRVSLAGLRAHRDSLTVGLDVLAKNDDPAFLREALHIWTSRNLEFSFEDLAPIIQWIDGESPWLLEAVGQLLEADAETAFAELSADYADTPLSWDARFEALAWRLHPASAVTAWQARAMSLQLDEDARRRAIDALAFSPGRAAADAVMLVATAGPEDLRGYAAWWVENRSTNDWREYGLRIDTGTRADATLAWESDVMRNGVARVDVDVTGAGKAWLVVTDGGDGNSCDWAAWLEPRVVLQDGNEVSLVGAWVEAQTGWGSVNANADSRGGPLEVAEERFEIGIGVHANSEVAFALPEGAVRLLARCGPEKGGTEQMDGNATSITFQVWLEREPEPKPLLQWLGVVTGSDGLEEDRRAAAASLASDGQGALLLIKARQEDRIPEALIPGIAELLFKNTDLAVRALASEQFDRPGMEGKKLPSIAELMALEGDVGRGRALFHDSQRARCITCHAFQLGERRIGVDLGPELTMIRKKLTGEALFDAILNPSASIAFGYDTYVLETDDGLLHSGFLLADGATIALLGTDGERVTFGADEVTSRHKQSMSTMPQGLALDLTPQDLADLVAFLADDPDVEPVYGPEIVLFDGAAMDAWTYYLSGGDTTYEDVSSVNVRDDNFFFFDVWSVRDGVLRCEGKPAGYIRTKESFDNYRLTLEWRFDPEAGPGNSGVLLRMTGENQIWPRSIEAQLQHRNAGDFWNIDKVVMLPEPSRTKGRNTKRMAPSSEKPLGEWNRYDILVNGPRVELRVNGVLQNTADWCEEVAGPICLQSEGAVIEFREIRLRPIVR